MRRQRGLLPRLVVVLGVWCGAPTRAEATVMPCSDCWTRGEGAVLPAGQDPEYFPGRASGDRTCPSEQPFVSGETETCGCMKPYHGKVCSERRCCRAKYECYGNCGDFTGLYIFLLVLFGLAVSGFVYQEVKRRQAQTVAAQDGEL